MCRVPYTGLLNNVAGILIRSCFVKSFCVILQCLAQLLAPCRMAASTKARLAHNADAIAWAIFDFGTRSKRPCAMSHGKSCGFVCRGSRLVNHFTLHAGVTEASTFVTFGPAERRHDPSVTADPAAAAWPLLASKHRLRYPQRILVSFL